MKELSVPVHSYRLRYGSMTGLGESRLVRAASTGYGQQICYGTQGQ